MFSRIAVINRGEPAVRLIRAVRELNAEFGYGIKVIALHTAGRARRAVRPVGRRGRACCGTRATWAARTWTTPSWNGR